MVDPVSAVDPCIDAPANADRVIVGDGITGKRRAGIVLFILAGLMAIESVVLSIFPWNATALNLTWLVVLLLAIVLYRRYAGYRRRTGLGKPLIWWSVRGISVADVGTIPWQNVRRIGSGFLPANGVPQLFIETKCPADGARPSLPETIWVIVAPTGMRSCDVKEMLDDAFRTYGPADPASA